MAFDVITPTKFGQAAITTGVTTLYTVPASTRALLKEFSIANTTAAAINVRVFLVPSAGSAGTGNAFLYDVPPAVVLNEAIDLAKYFSNADAGRFVNGILDRFHKDNEKG